MSADRDHERLVRALKERVGGAVLDGPAERELFSRDTGIFRVVPVAAVVPRSVEDIRVVLDLARAEGVPVTARGGASNTGGAAVGSGIVLHFRPRGPFSGVGSPAGAEGRLRITAQAAARHDTVQEALAAAGHVLPSDPSSGPLSLLGGNIATRASGPHALRYGAIDRYLVSARFLLADGTLVDTASADTIPKGLVADLDRIRTELGADTVSVDRIRARAGLKSASGYNLGALLEDVGGSRLVTQLLAGSMGTLGLVVDATLEARAAPSGRSALLVCPRDLGGACRLAVVFRDLGAAAVEIMNARSVELVRARLPRSGIPDNTGHLLLVEMDGEEALERAHAAAAAAIRSGERLAAEPVVREDPEEIGGLWRARKLMLPLLRGGEERTRALSVVNDVGVPPALMDQAIVRLEAIFERRGLDAFIYGHAGDGNLHLRPLFNTGGDVKREILGVAEEVYDCVLSMGGTVTGEHGLGMLRAPWLEREWGSGPYRIMEQVKKAFDPAGLLNPGAVLPALGLREALDRYFAP